MTKVKYINSTLKKNKNKKKEQKEQKRADIINRMALYQEKYQKASNKILNICNLRINDSAEEEQNNERFTQDIIHQTIEVVYQTLFNLLGAFRRKEIKRIRKRLNRNQ